jgi:hypothetical protein
MESSNFPGEIALGLGIVTLTGAAFYTVQSVFNMATTIQNRYLELLPYTLSSDKQEIIQQDPSTFTDAKTILPSENERTGTEFSYSFYLLVNEGTFDGEDNLHSVFFKGNDNNPWPLLSPGVFVKGNSNTLRIIYGSFSDAYNHIDIENIPVGKWFHVVLNYQKNALEVHINGRLVKKLSFENALPYNNFGNINIFSNSVKTVNLPNNRNVRFNGAITGKLSSLIYTRYALSFKEIKEFYDKGPSSSTKVVSSDELPPYLADSWWNQ